MLKKFSAKILLFIIAGISIIMARTGGSRKFFDKLVISGRKNFYFALRDDVPFQVLIYHRILASEDPFAIDVIPIASFRKQMEILKSSMRIISTDQLVRELDQRALEPNTICITFDDGYIDNYQNAFPILKELDIPATIFLASGHIQNEKLFWFDRILQMVKATNLASFSFPEANIHRFSLNHVTEKIMGPVANNAARLMLNWDEIREMFAENISFGAHSLTHPILAKLNDQELSEEINTSIRVIEKNLDAPVTAFAYPNGKPEDFDFGLGLR